MFRPHLANFEKFIFVTFWRPKSNQKTPSRGLFFPLVAFSINLTWKYSGILGRLAHLKMTGSPSYLGS
jgi:hypothetical protein